MTPEHRNYTTFCDNHVSCFALEDGKYTLNALCFEYKLQIKKRSYSLYILVNDNWEKFYTLNRFENYAYMNDYILLGHMVLIRDDIITYVVDTKVLSLKDLSFRKIFRQLSTNGIRLKDMKKVLNLPTFLNMQYFAPI